MQKLSAFASLRDDLFGSQYGARLVLAGAIRCSSCPLPCLPRDACPLLVGEPPAVIHDQAVFIDRRYKNSQLLHHNRGDGAIETVFYRR
jgi:hypothetical protein